MRFFEDCKRLLRIATKPTKGDFWLSVKICLAGVGLIGAIAFIIRMVSTILAGI